MTAPIPQLGTLITEEQAEDLATLLGQTVTTTGLAVAELVISLRTGCDISDTDVVDNMDPTDRYWLAQAVVFQAIWQKGNTDILTRIDVAQTSTDGDAINVNHDGLLLAPMAKWAILKTTLMSWDTAESAPTRGGVESPNLEAIGYRRTRW